MKGSIGFVVCGLLVGVADLAHAQSGASGGAFGIGPRVTFQRGDEAIPDSSALRVFGGQIKMRLSPSTAIEVSADYDSKLSKTTTLTQRARSMPIQASLLMFPIRSVISPYVLGGVGWYRHSLTTSASGASSASGATTTETIREMGYHAGLGAELRVGQRMAIHGDYRYNHIRFGGSGSSSTQLRRETPNAALIGLSSVPGLSAIQESLKLSNGGSMWNWGVTFFF
jgi:opacity protein-like surface antigen